MKRWCVVAVIVACVGISCGEDDSGESGRVVGMTAAHNEVRAQVGLGEVIWDEEVASFAQTWADALQGRGCEMEHRPRSGEFAQRYGENLAWAAGQNLSAEQVVAMWASEASAYTYSDNSCVGVCGHYTQIVWASTQRVGCAVASCDRSEIWVCNYDPPGNIIGQRPY